MMNISEINKVNRLEKSLDSKDLSQRGVNPGVVKTEGETVSQTESPTPSTHPETTQPLDLTSMGGPAEATDPLVSVKHTHEELSVVGESEEEALSTRSDEELITRINSLGDEGDAEEEEQKDSSYGKQSHRENEVAVVEDRDQESENLTDDEEGDHVLREPEAVSVWGVNPLVQVNNKLTLRTRNVLSPYIEDHALLNRREKELMQGGKANTAEKIMNDMMTHLQLLMESAEIVLDEEDHQENDHVMYVQDPMGDLVRYRRDHGDDVARDDDDVHASSASHTEHAVGMMVVEARVGMGPVVETTTVKRGGASYQVPTPIHQGRRESRAVRWLVEGAKLRLKKDHLHGMAESLALEVLHILNDRDLLKKQDAEQSESTEVKDTNIQLASYGVNKMVTLHKNAKANRVFTHRRWH